MSNSDLDFLYSLLVIILLTLLSIDFWQQKKQAWREMSIKQAIYWSVVWIAVALCFNCFIGIYFYFKSGLATSIEYSVNFFSGYLIEKSLAIDNVFVWLLIFNSFAIPLKQQKRVLFYGVLGAVLLRIIMISLASQLIQQFNWLLYLFGFFLLWMGVKSFKDDKQKVLVESPYLSKLKTFFCEKSTEAKEKFWIKRQNRWYPTILLFVLILIELSDIIFAVDSIPAVFAITTNTFIVISSNLFAILGLRALYFLVSAVLKKYTFFRYAVGILLIFVGLKMLTAHFITISAITSLLIISFIFLSGYLFEQFFIKKN